MSTFRFGDSAVFLSQANKLAQKRNISTKNTGYLCWFLKNCSAKATCPSLSPCQNNTSTGTPRSWRRAAVPRKPSRMRNKLQKFSDYAETLLPHETGYLLATQRFNDAHKRQILEITHQNCLRASSRIAYDETLDKRKYSSLKKWMETKLHELDADAQFEWMGEMERKIVTDTINPAEERALLHALRRAKPTDYFFVKFYELVQGFRHYLLIRMRFKEHQQADKFLKEYQQAWQRSKDTFEKLHEATVDIVGQYSTGSAESVKWQEWLTAVLYDESLDGQNRYFAFIRLIFVHLNYGRLSALLEKFDYQDKLLEKGTYYSRRLLLNYYGQRLLFHSKLKDYEKAEYYGRLSVRGKNSDYLFYLNNLVAVLLRSKKNQQALALMKLAHAEARTTTNFYNRVGFVSFYMRCLICNGQYKNAESFGTSFMKAYLREILQYRWHLFFTNYLGALFHLGKYAKLLSTVRRYGLLDRDNQYRQNKPSSYLPFIPWYFKLAEYAETGCGLAEFLAEVNAYIQAQPPQTDRLPLLMEFLEELKTKMPELH